MGGGGERERERELVETPHPLIFLLPAQAYIFENNQRDLEVATENLSGFLEGEASAAEDFLTLKQKVGRGSDPFLP